MADQDAARLAAKLGDRNWRLENLYWIRDKAGQTVLFVPNATQRQLLADLHTLNVICKARQLGMTTFIQLLILDVCLFNSGIQAGVVAHSKEDAQAIFDTKLKFAYERLPDWLRAEIVATTDRAGELEFSNGSRIRVATSLRSGTYQIVHISEYGKICRKYPDKAQEIKTGTLETVAVGQYVFIESTAGGRFGDFYDLVQRAGRRADDPRPLLPLEYRLHFYPWFLDPEYRVPSAGVPIPDKLTEYFAELEAKLRVTIDPDQRAWYALKSETLRDSMLSEYPSTVEEAFTRAVEGAYYAKEMTLLRKHGQIRKIPVAPGIPVHSFWDLGHADKMAIWLMQEVAGQPRFLKCYQNSGEGFAHYVKWINDQGYVRGKFYLPHDAEQKQLTATGGKSAVDWMSELNIPSSDLIVVPRVALISDGIEAARQALPLCWIDPEGCAEGITALDSYRKEWDDKLGTWKDQPLHDEFSHLADAFRQYAQGYRLGQSLRQRLPTTGRVA